MRTERLLRLAVECPNPVCGVGPGIRLFPDEPERYRDDDPDEPVCMLQCQRCGNRYVVTARAYQEAAA